MDQFKVLTFIVQCRVDYNKAIKRWRDGGRYEGGKRESWSE